MLNNIFRLFTARQLPVTFFGLLFTLGVVGEQAKPVLSNEIQQVPTSTTLATNYLESTNQSDNSHKTPLLGQLKEVREQRSQLSATSVDSDAYANQGLEQNFHQPELTSSTTSLKNVKAIPTTTTAMVVDNQKAAKQPGVQPTENFLTRDGVYLYGQSPKPNQLGQGYVLFHNQQGRVVGALYMPQSEFSCFQGTLDKSGALAMTVTGSPDESGSNEVATANRLPNLNEDEPNAYAYSIALQDYHRVSSISANDQRILQMCNQSAADVYTKLVK
ncbi:hypothetical protein I8752_09420 [Nostocaceae cyanobacterium CENA369]|uniref:Uncharacterized protein n=1 Tax=Dendronalium phyllosphericum CENA369 TaxID=1725256 RepID=A0A8J7I3V7_9NOST|nr:hypothetical protein [Dendronalium phyllosphericum]MBH8573233.1 hypothetical protein [Dendronalium phyllosphericum CENA369]